MSVNLSLTNAEAVVLKETLGGYCTSDELMRIYDKLDIALTRKKKGRS